jgi:CMP-N-acetylneuraminic acid synthetase
MTSEPRPLGLIPARGGSKRLPRKNLAELGGKPMLAWTIEAALGSGLFEQVHVSTEDDEIADVARRHGAAVPFRRAAALATDEARVTDVVLDALDWFAGRGMRHHTVCVLLPSSPLRRADDVVGTWRRFHDTGADAAMAVTRYLHPPWQALREEGGLLVPHWGRDVIARKSQEVPPLWVDSGAVYVIRAEALRRDRTFYVERLVGYPIDPARALDIDDAFQLALARAILALDAVPSAVGGPS